MKKLIFLIVCITITTILHAQTGTISGKVNIPDDNEGVLVNIGLNGTNKGTIIDEKGNYIISKVDEGSYLLEASSIGLKTQKINVSVIAGQETVVPAFNMEKTDEKIGEVLIMGNRYSSYIADKSSQSLRFNTPLLEAAQNIQVVTKDLLDDQQLVDMRESITRNISGAQMIEHWGSFARINMRGFKIPAFRNGMNVDLPWGPLTEDMSIVERIEFVKGPAGFMLSSGEPGGFYNVVTKKAEADQTNEISLMMGSFNTLRTAVDLGGKLSKDERLLFRLNLMGSTKDSHRDYEFNDRYTIAPSIKFLIDEKTTLTAEYIYQHSKMSNIGSAYVFSPNGFGDLPRDFTLLEPNIDPTNISEHNAFVNLEHKLNENWTFTAQLGYVNYEQIGSSLWADSVSTEGLVYRNISIGDAVSTAKLGQAFVNGEIQTGAINHRILAGVDIGDKEYYADWFQGGSLGGVDNPIDIYNPVHSVHTSAMPVFDRSMSIRQRAYNGSYPASQMTRYSSLYVQDELGFFDNHLRLTLAGRYTSYKTDVYGASTDDEVVTPRVGISYSIDENTSVYALSDQSFLPQSGSDKNGKAFDPVEGHDLEAGIKRKWANGRWNSSLTFYKITKENVLTSDPEDVNYSIQLGEAESKGFEFDIQGEIVSGLNLILNYANTNVKVSKDSDPTKVGTRMAGHAKHMTNGWLKYQFKSRGLKGLGLGLGYQYQVDRSSWAWGSGNESILPDYFRLDGAVSWKNEDFSVGLNINNLLDKYLYSGSGYSGFYYWQTEPGTNFRLNVSYKF
ncbi:TonB-dependent siderophore receptor [Labilibaculum manganireducens]|uniref:TonB-dependent siderophore receptor n=1 Tax=Labilibaculum manganireducens TaxID=1940525 RepID=A0A2N3IBJ8_9BACT|nr:TonB-dependent siderophore receptor [Labilibaculum manganireducens]PKQ67696.1 TonB-dependent siderophore receptor [Labilibaculum manganireducens]